MLNGILGVSAAPVGGRGHTLWTATDVAERSFESTARSRCGLLLVFSCFCSGCFSFLIYLLAFNEILLNKRVRIGMCTFPGSLRMVNDVTVALDCSDSQLCQR